MGGVFGKTSFVFCNEGHLQDDSKRQNRTPLDSPERSYQGQKDSNCEVDGPFGTDFPVNKMVGQQLQALMHKCGSILSATEMSRSCVMFHQNQSGPNSENACVQIHQCGAELHNVQ